MGTPTKKRKRKRKARADSFKRLKDLPNHDEVHSKLCANISCEETARWLQEDTGQCTDIQRSGLVRQLYRYRDSIPPGEREFKEVSEFNTAVATYSHQIATLEEMTKLYELQTVRIGRALVLEEKSTLPLPVVGREVDRAQSLLHSIARLKGEMGLLDKMGERLIGDSGLQDTLATGALAVLRERHGPEAVSKLLMAGKRLQEALMKMPTHQRPPVAVTDSGVEVHTTSENGNGTAPTGGPT